MTKQKSKKLFESSLYFSCFEATRKASEGMYLLITNKSVINEAQKEADNLLIKFCGYRQSNSNQTLPKRKKRHNQVSSYVATLSKNTSQLPLKQCYILPHPTKDQFPLPSPLSLSTRTNHWPYLHHPSIFRLNSPHHLFRNKNFTMISRPSIQRQQPIPLTISSPHPPGRMN